MIKLQALENFSLERFNEIEMVERAGKEQNKWVNKNDIFKCKKDLADYLLGANPLGRPVVRVIEVEPIKVKKELVKPLEEAPIEDALSEEATKSYLSNKPIKPKKKKSSKK